MALNGRRIEIGANVAIVLVLLLMLGFYIRDRRSLPPSDASTREPVMIEKWEEEADRGIAMGPPSAAVTIVEFMDLQCPYCAGFAARLDSLREEFGEGVRVVFHHFPLPSHPLALAAAVAGECAERQGAFEALLTTLFRQQSDLGVKSWREFAGDAGISDMVAFEACVGLPADSFPRIGYGRELGARTGVTGTPTVWVNGWKEPFPPTLERLRALVRESLKLSK